MINRSCYDHCSQHGETTLDLTVMQMSSVTCAECFMSYININRYV